MKAESEREVRKKERMEKEMKELKSALEARQLEIKHKQSLVSSAEEQVSKLQSLIKEANQATDKVQKEYNLLSEKSMKLHHDLEDQIHTNTQLLAENSQRQVELKVKEDEIAQIKVEATRVNKIRESTINKMKNLEKMKGDVEKARDTMRTEIGGLEREIESQRKGLEVERKKQEELMRERDILTKLKTQAENATQRQIDLVKINDNTKRNLEQEIQGYKVEAQKQQKLIFQLEKEREKYGIEASEANGKYMQALEEVKLREMAIIDLQKKIAEGENRLKQQQNLYEAVRSDRNLYSKNLIEAQDEIQEMKRKFKIINHQIEQLKEEISAKDLALVKEHFDHMKV